MGGISSAMPLVFRAAIKPTATIGTSQDSIDLDTHQNTQIIGKGRHDPCIVPRALACIEAAAAIAVLDEILNDK